PAAASSASEAAVCVSCPCADCPDTPPLPGLLHAVCALSLRTLGCPISAHYGPSLKYGRFLVFNPRFFDALQAPAAGNGSDPRADTAGCRLLAFVRTSLRTAIYADPFLP